MRISDWSSDVCSSDLFPSHDKVALLTKPGKYICTQNGTSTPLCYIHPNNSGRLDGTSTQFFSFSSTVPFIVYGRGTVQYVGEL